MTTAVVGALRVVLGLESASFTEGLNAAQREMRKAGREFAKIGAQLSSVGKTLSLSVTAPIAALGFSAIKAASDFEASMIKVGISTKATAQEMAAMETQARQIGKATVFSATEAADAMDMLAKTGLDTKIILGGAAKAAVDLAAAAGSGLEPAAAAISDTLQQFKLQTSELPSIVNQITGAVNESKLSFEDYTYAIGQAGGVAAGLGVSFKDFNAVISGTSSLFASGQDAGTSFKTFLQRLVPQTEGAAAAMAQYGLKFFDAAGQMKSMGEIAEMLRTKLGGLSDEAKTQVLTKLFGTDAMRTAIGLMDQGAAGLDKIAKAIAAADAAAQAAKRMEGLKGQMEQLRGAFEDLGIAIGKSGVLDAVTGIVKGLGDLTERLAGADPALIRIGVAIAAVAAAIGPLAIVAGAAVSAVGAILGALAAPGAAAVIAAVAVGVAAVGAAFLIFGDEIVPALKSFGQALQDTIGPKLQPLFEALKGLVASLSATFDAVFGGDGNLKILLTGFGELIARVFGVAVDLLTGAINVISEVLQTLAAVLRGDASAAFKHFGSIVPAAAKAISAAFKTLFPEVVAAVKAMYEGVRTWLVDKLGGVMKAVADKAKAVGDAFFELYDRVVGHSYVPDMVTEIGREFQKLDAKMVKPSKASTAEAAKAFLEMRDEVQAALAELDTQGLTANQIQATRQRAIAARFLGEGLAFEAAQALRAADGFDKLDEVQKRAISPATASGLQEIGDAMERIGEVAKRTFVDDLQDSLARAGDIFNGLGRDIDALFRGIKNRDWGSAFAGMLSAAKQVQAAFSAGGTTGDKVSAIGGIASAIGNAIGGKGGRALSSASNAAVTAFTATGNPMVAAAAAVVAGLGELLKPKPSNAGAGYDLVTGALSGKSRTPETEAAAAQTGQAIKQGQDLIRQYATLSTTINGLVIGTRDQTQIYTSAGETLRTAVGDAGAAAEAALQAVLRGATFTNTAQQTLVADMLAAGKGFDAIIAALGEFKAGLEAAQGVLPALDAEIERLRASLGTPDEQRAYEVAQVRKWGEDQRQAYQAMVDAGHLTAEAFTVIASRIATIEDLNIQAVLKRFADATGAAAQAAFGLTDTLEAAVNITRKSNVTPSVRDMLAGVNVASLVRGQIETPQTARDRDIPVTGGKTVADLLSNKAIVAQVDAKLGASWRASGATFAAFEAANDDWVAALVETTKVFHDLAGSLADFAKELTFGDLSILAPAQQLEAAQAAFAATAPKALLGDVGALQALEGLGRQLIESQRAITGSGEETVKITDLVRQAVVTASKLTGPGPSRGAQDIFYRPSGALSDQLIPGAVRGLGEADRKLLQAINDKLGARLTQAGAISQADQKALARLQDASDRTARLAAQGKVAA